ncbi:unnamed protein product [Notodromas monacha]|uniref:Uncharacterized protein n=1 Tax=Notodromas monacha TaxID=399045 RepID=A0A7R9C2X2_9CRUS|nr:unnamed protein product [Notodromas monacha]CAG0925472.1 unnamed protein product [Notodromas monacha]
MTGYSQIAEKTIVVLGLFWHVLVFLGHAYSASRRHFRCCSGDRLQKQRLLMTIVFSFIPPFTMLEKRCFI